MIGVLSKNSEREIVAEFFQLFKTPWEFYDKDRQYDVLVITTGDFDSVNARSVIIYSPEQIPFDLTKNITTSPLKKNVLMQFENDQIPVYCGAATILGKGNPFLQTKNGVESAALTIDEPGQTFIRIGYSLFDEVSFLLSSGQPPENALIPTLDLHISILRNLILQTGIPLVEIPPVPAGYSFITCLTHDIDFIRIRDHKFDHTMWGFFYRAIIGTLLNVIKGKNSWKNLLQNWKAVAVLPFVHVGLHKDFWFKFDRYMELEKNIGARSTFFLIPFKNRMGKNITGNGANRRAAKYDVMDIQGTVRKLTNEGFEVGVHGIDAWHDTAMARQELSRISEVTKQSEVGIRVHWLCFDKSTYQTLDDAGFSYDTTFGYNNAVGYRAGTTQTFRPIGTKHIFELPLHIQDTALFNPKHMSLTKAEAWQLGNDLIEKELVHGGVLTILWHDRSLSPERLYEDFYVKLLNKLRNQKVWFATATDICNWFNSRRMVKFKNVNISGNKISIKLETGHANPHPSMKLRFYHPSIQEQHNPVPYQYHTNYTDLPWQNETEISVKI